MNKLFELRATLDAKTKTIVEISGFVILLMVWQFVCMSGWVSKSILPSPLAVISSLKELHFEDALILNMGYSIKLNILGYIEAIAICLPVGFVIGLFPIFREMFRKYLDAIRFVPLPAVVGLFIAWFGIDTNMKVQFLAAGIVVYLLPVVVLRIQEVDDTYVQTIETLSKNRWDIIRKVFMPSALAAIFNDIRVLVAISWTYITVAELVNKSGGIGSIAYLAARQSRVDKVFAVMLIIVLIGYIQDMTFEAIDKILFPYKYSSKTK